MIRGLKAAEQETDQKIRPVEDKQYVTHQGRDLKKMRVEVPSPEGQGVVHHNRLVGMIQIGEAEIHADDSDQKSER